MCELLLEAMLTVVICGENPAWPTVLWAQGARWSVASGLRFFGVCPAVVCSELMLGSVSACVLGSADVISVRPGRAQGAVSFQKRCWCGTVLCGPAAYGLSVDSWGVSASLTTRAWLTSRAL